MPKNDAAERAFRFHFATTIRDELTREEAVDLWVPLPQDTQEQRIGPLEIESPLPFQEAVEPRWNNRMIYLRVPKGAPSTTVKVSYDVRRTRQKVAAPSPSASFDASFDPKAFELHLKADSHVPTDGFIAQQSASVTSKDDPPVVRARKIFEHLMSTIEYDKAGCTPDRFDQLGNLAQACDLRRGTCTEFHGLFVAYARSVGLPARFKFGFNVPENSDQGIVGGYHCWAEAYLPSAGWFPVDVSEAVKARAKDYPQEAVDFYFGGTDCHRVHLTNGRDVLLMPRLQSEPVDKLIFAHALRGAEKLDTELAFSISPTKAR